MGLGPRGRSIRLGWLAFLVALLAAFAEPALAQITDINNAINKAGRQRMLSQRVAKTYLQLGLKVDVETSTRALDNAVALFDRQLVELKNFAPTPEIRETYLQLEQAWIVYKDLVIGVAPNPESARKVMELSEQVLELAHRGTEQLVRHSGSESGPLVGVAGRQRMLSQRMSKFYMALAWGVAPANGASELDKSRRAFATGLKALSAAPATTAAIRAELEKAREQWAALEGALDAAGGDKKTRAQAVVTTGERVLNSMDEITGLFEKLGQ